MHMELITAIFAVFMILTFRSAKIEVNGTQEISFWTRLGVCALASMIMSLLIGLPILGILSLFN